MRKVFGYLLIIFASLLALSLFTQIDDLFVLFAIALSGNAEDLNSYRGGYMLGQIIGFLLLLGLTIGCFICGRKLIRNKPKNKAIAELLENN